MSGIKLYSVSDGPPSLTVKLLLEILGLPYENIEVDFVAGEHISEEYAKKNPQKEIPVLDDNGFYLSESNAILQYLADKYGNKNNIYPTDIQTRAIVNQRLCFNLSTYYRFISEHVVAPMFYDYQRTPLSEKKTHIALSVFNVYLKRDGFKYAASDNLTIADLPLIASTMCLEVIDFDFSRYEEITKWYETFKKENVKLWAITKVVMLELKGFSINPPDLSHLKHHLHPVRKV